MADKTNKALNKLLLKKLVKAKVKAKAKKLEAFTNGKKALGLSFELREKDEFIVNQQIEIQRLKGELKETPKIGEDVGEVCNLHGCKGLMDRAIDLECSCSQSGGQCQNCVTFDIVCNTCDHRILIYE